MPLAREYEGANLLNTLIREPAFPFSTPDRVTVSAGRIRSEQRETARHAESPQLEGRSFSSTCSASTTSRVIGCRMSSWVVSRGTPTVGGRRDGRKRHSCVVGVKTEPLSDNGDRKIRSVEQALGALDTKRERHLQRRGTEMLGKQARQVTRPSPSRPESASIFSRSRAPSSIRAGAHSTVALVPFHAGQNGAVSGRHRRQGRYPARSAAAALG